jgi:hypothetical protein
MAKHSAQAVDDQDAGFAGVGWHESSETDDATALEQVSVAGSKQ